MKKLWKRNQIMITALALMIAVAGYLNFMGRQVDENALFTTSAQFEETDDNLSAQAQADGEDAMARISDITTDDELALMTEDNDEYQALTDIDSMDSDEEMVYSDYLDENGEAVTTSTDALDMNSLSAGADRQNGLALTGTQEDNQVAEVTEDYTGETPGEAVFTSSTSITTIQSANLLKEQTREKNKQALMEIINSDSLSEDAKQDAVDQMISLTDVTQRECSAQIMLEAKGFEDVVVSISGQQADVIVVTDNLTEAMRAQIEDIVSRKTGISCENIIISPVSPK